MVEFTTDEISVYALVDTRDPSSQGTPPDGSNQNAATGDQTNVIFWLSLLVLAGGCLSISLRRYKMKQE